jgi:ABC-type molybdenum transport system ATPase subunit/photorepair protein PhrA
MTLTHPGEELARRTGRSGWASGRYNGTNLTGSKGSGKSTLAADIAFYDYLQDGGIGQILLDPIGVGLIDAFLWRLWRFLRKVPLSHQPRFLERIKYINVAASDYISPFPLLYKTGAERSLLDVAERYLQTILLLSLEQIYKLRLESVP